MCVILHKLKESKPFSIDEVTNATDVNPDGFSITTISGTNYNIYKTLNKNEFISKYKDCLENGKLDNIEYIIHCRIATNGSISTDNCHPFENDNFVLWHNGIIPEFSDNKKICDSKQFLDKYFTSPNIKTETIIKRFETVPTSKFIIYRKSNGEVISSNNFIIHEDNYVSNTNHLWTKYDYNDFANLSWYDYGYDDENYMNEYINNDYINMINYIDSINISLMNKKELINYIRELENFIYEKGGC